MIAIGSTLLVGLLALQNVFAAPSNLGKRDLDSWLTTEYSKATTELICNIGSGGCNANGVASGLVIASPSKSEPDYWYHWTRDSALVFKYIFDRFNAGYDAGLQTQIQNYIAGQAKLQGVSNPSGSLSNGAGLGEAKYNVDGSAYTGGWGRPQRDGPALRATVLASYGTWLVDNGYTATAQSVVWPVVANDLAYVVQYWNQTGFDLWEEVSGSSFFTTAVQHRSLIEGIAFASKIGKTCNNCATVAPQILCFQQTFWNTAGYMVSNINGNFGRSGKDGNSILASIHNFDAEAGCDDSTFQPCSPRALANHKAVSDSFRSAYGINSGIAAGQGVAIGRYTEDVYYGGNPWYLLTFAAAEQLYDALIQWNNKGSITITSVSLNFFKDIYPSAAVGTYSSGSAAFTAITTATKTYADGFMAKAQKHTPTSGDLAEQYDRNTGFALGAADLTWSYAAFLSATDRRNGIVPRSWKSSTANTAPSGNCGNAQYGGSYTSATNTVFPANQTPGTAATGTSTVTGTATTTSTATSTPTSCAIASTVSVTFNELVTTTFGQNIKIVGSISQIGSWNTANSIALGASGYTSSNPLWSVTISLPAGTTFAYKFIKVSSTGAVTWESDPNRQYTVPSSCETSVAVGSSWR
ncbi:hypothetical protein V498_03882 [Pseudogymnoascus sp. VKM F-4517 (FW-2822)]|nr:hypothetical protein V498_03882 [Pseudogymnoascus sp. VKM F-4517 (FW-2822)]